MIKIEEIDGISSNNKGIKMLEASQKLVAHVNYSERLKENKQDIQKKPDAKEIE